MSATPGWNSVPLGAAVALNAADIHVWRVPLERTEAQIRRTREILSPDEILRADRFYFQRDRDSFVAARGTLRQLLGEYLKRSPEEIDFAYGAYGKPSLRQGSATPSDRKSVV